MSGRRAGYCAGFDTPGFAGQGAGRGAGFGRGRGASGGGRGHRNRFFATGVPGWARSGGAVPPLEAAPEQAVAALGEQVGALKVEMEKLQARLAGIVTAREEKK